MSGKCRACPSEMEAPQMDCPSCDGLGDGCPACYDPRSKCSRGTFVLTTCPLTIVPPTIWDLLDYIELYGKGLPPIHGGALDQCHTFLDAARFVMAEEASTKAELGMMG